MGRHRPGLGRYPMRGGRRDRVTKTMRHGVQPRLTLKQKEARFQRKRGIRYRPARDAGSQSPEA